MTFFKLFFIFLITENIYQKYIPGLNYFDEIITIFAGYLLISSSKVKELWWKYCLKILSCIFIIVIIGIFATAYYKIQPEFGGIWRDAFAIIKFPVCYCGLLLYMNKYDKGKVQKSVLGFCKFYICVLFVFGIYNFVFYTPWLSNGIRYGFPLYSFLYTHNTFLIIAVLSMLAVLLSDNMQRNKIYIILGLSVLVLTFRSKAFIPIIFIVFAYLWIKRERKIKHQKIKILLGVLIIAVVALYFSSGRIDEYVSYGDTSARGAFYIYGLDVASKYFPTGSGFCTFASTLSAEYYSPLYYDYGMNYIYGLTEDDHSYAGDVFWPNIYAQYGYIGLVSYLLMIWFFLKSLFSRYRIFSTQWIGSVAIFLYSISAAFAESFYTNDSGVITAVVLAMYLGNDNFLMKKVKV